MPVCASAILQPDGAYYLALNPSVTDLSTCAYVVDTGGANAWRELGNLSISDAQVISAYVAGVWAIAWGFKALCNSISPFESVNHE